MDTTQFIVSSIAGLIIFLITFKYYFMSAAKCRSKARLDGKNVIITGANTGIGKESAIELAKRGARVILACRDTGKAERALVDILEAVPNAKVEVKHLDLSSLTSIRTFADDINISLESLHILINNAGLGGLSERRLTEDGFEMTFGVNHLGHFLLTNLLLIKMRESVPSRIVNVSAHAHLFSNIDFSDLMMEKDYGGITAYCRSKLANILFTRELARRLEGTGVTVYSLHPGIIHTELGRHFTFLNRPLVKRLIDFLQRVFLMSARDGCQTTVYCAVSESLSKMSGLYYSNCALSTPSRFALNEEHGKLLWQHSEKLVGINADYNQTDSYDNQTDSYDNQTDSKDESDE